MLTSGPPERVYQFDNLIHSIPDMPAWQSDISERQAL
jgi:hypothetical protein